MKRISDMFTAGKSWYHAAVVWAAVALLTTLPCCTSHQAEKKRAQPVISDSLAYRLWYKNSIIYNLDVEKFMDSDGDGIGDFRGLTQRIGYIDSLGADVIWLAPFQPTPNEDDGYDVTDYYSIDKRLGTAQDFRSFMRAAEHHHIRVIMDLVVNHTSDQHPWFLQARKDPHSPYRDWYIWSRKKPANYGKGMVFPGVQRDIWTYDSVAQRYYYHRFYDFQPDLNLQNPHVRQQIHHIISYWLNLGIWGFRLDGVPFFIEVAKTKGKKFERQYALLENMRRYIDSLRPGAIILGEANVPPEENELYFGRDGAAMNMMFNFYVNQHLFYSLASANAADLKKALEATHDIPTVSQWGQFLRNHDEVDLARLTKKERSLVYKEFGAEDRMQLYHRGIRRRLAPMLANDLQRLKMAYSILFSLPSTPVIRYGEELGMGDDLALKERESIRTPMQWSDAPNAGFSTSDTLVKPVIEEGRFSYKYINVDTENKNRSSLLQFIRCLIHLRKTHPEMAYGDWSLPETGSQHVYCIRYSWKGHTLLLAHNLSNIAEKITVHEPAILYDLFSGAGLLPAGNGAHSIMLGRYDYKWYEVKINQGR